MASRQIKDTKMKLIDNIAQDKKMMNIRNLCQKINLKNFQKT